MGMFDNITVKKKLPLTKELKALNVKWDEEVFQTKDLDNLLDNYEITKSGKNGPVINKAGIRLVSMTGRLIKNIFSTLLILT